MLGTQQPDTGSGELAEKTTEFLKIAAEPWGGESAPRGHPAENPGKQGSTWKVQTAKWLRRCRVFLQSSFKPVCRVHALCVFLNDTSLLTVGMYCFHSLPFINIMSTYHSSIVRTSYNDVFFERVPMTGLYPW